MANGTPPDDRFVTWGRWDAEHRALRDHEDAEHRRLGDRIGDAEDRVAVLEQAAAARTERRWNVLMVILGSLILPLLLAAVVALVTAAHQGG